jgi:hypothetical protein
MNNRTPAEVAERLDQFVIALQSHINECSKDYPFAPRQVSIEIGKRYARVVLTEYYEDGRVLTRSVHSFVELETGNILKSAGWKAPAKGVRGNIFDDNFSINKGVTQYGAIYFK